MKRLMAFVLCMAMCIGLVACAPSNAEQTTTPTTQAPTEATTTTEPEELAVDQFKGTKLTIAVSNPNAGTTFDWTAKEIFKLVTEATGIEVEWILVDPGVIKEKLATLLMSDNPPDVFIGFGNDETTFLNNPDVFYDLSEEGLLDTYAPNIVRDYDLNPAAWTSITYGDGSIRGLVTGDLTPPILGDGLSANLAINQAWLDKANLPVPSTAEELYNTLKYFKEHDMDGDGDPNNEIPMSFCMGHAQGDIMLFAAAFGIAGNYTWQAKDHYKNIKDGKVVSTMDTANYRAFLEFFHKLYSEGLLDIEGFSQTSDQFLAKRKAMTVGVFHTLGDFLDEGYTPFLYQGMEGVTPMISGYAERFRGQRNSFAISADSENVEAALWWWNWMSKDTETKLIAATGSIGFVKNADGTFSVNPEYNGNASEQGMGNWAPLKMPDDQPQSDLASMAEKKRVRNEFLNQYLETEHVNQESFPIMYSSNPAADEERGMIETELFTYLASFTAESISNGIDDAKWEQHLSDLKAYQYYEWLGLYQDLIDEAAARVG